MASDEVNNVAPGESPSVWIPLPNRKCIVNVCRESQTVRSNGYRWRAFGRPRCTSVHCKKNSVDKLTRKICRFTKHALMKALIPLEFKPPKSLKV